MWEEKIAVVPPYNFQRVLQRQSLDPLNKIDAVKKEVYVPIRDRNGEPHVVAVRETGSVEHPEFSIKSKNSSQKEYLLQEIRRIFQWDIPLSDIQRHFQDSNLSLIFEEHAGTPLVLDFDLYHCIMKCIIHQQLNLTFAFTLTERFVKTFGEEHEGVWFYPLPETIAALQYEDLKKLQFSGRKAEYAIDTSKRISSGELNLQELTKAGDQEIYDKLIKIRGIGPWTIQNVLLFGLGRPNLFPVTDIGIQNALKKHFGLEKKPSLEQMEEYSKLWEPYLSYASLYLWRSIE
ncbi:DNA-3-methyladenine glycosylase 2 family protein [Bacillus lacus]|uniref:DNA-3-methyladenine glycosylase II n=1 Tax=Metabacillus lacus TaxID=1983721 RepID=A0A7X2J1J4_9BACI|nr:DNA-3-methyladenine glycosylase [Metabacillus lacus]MRX73650.1 DNA-3-methyladenine glycosylase 2 family protein [Metabacillus lacus]